MWTREAGVHRGRRGSALLAVLWLSAALAAIAFSLSNTVRGETDRAATASEGLRSYYIAAGAVEDAAIRLLRFREDPRTQQGVLVGTVFHLEFPEGAADVEVIPEASRLDINGERPETLFRLLQALGVDPERSREVALAVLDWRTVRPPGVFSEFDSYYLSQVPSFHARHASFQEIEELLLVRGVTPDLFYGTYVPNPNAPAGQPRLVRRGGLADCVSVFGGGQPGIDVNTARPEVLEAIGLSPDLAAMVAERRRVGPITQAQLPELMQQAGPAAPRLRVGGNTIYTLRATARLRLAGGQFSDLKRTVAAQVKYMPPGYDSPIHILRWYDTAWSD